MRIPIFLLFLIISGNVFSQLGFCPGSKGEPIFHENFGGGQGTGAALPAGTTNYSYVVGDPQDGEYTISSDIGEGIGSWHNVLPQNTVSNGKALIVNADYNSAGLFYETAISGLCEATSYEFSAYLMNIYNGSSGVCPGTGIPINVRFEIWNETNSVLLASGSTGDIAGTSYPKWEQYALIFRSGAGQSNVILRMFNNGIGGCGNDLAIDDIIFRSCGDQTEVVLSNSNETSLDVCPPDIPVSVHLTATPDHSVYNTHAFQWQESIDEENWQDITGESGTTFTSSPVSSTRYFRVKVAEDAVNLADNLCSSVSEPFAVVVFEKAEAPVSKGNLKACEGDPIPSLEVMSKSDESVEWYESATGGEEIASGNTFVPSTSGTYYAEAVKSGSICEPGPRTPVTLEILSKPQVTDEDLQLCAGSEVQLDAGAGNFSYNWNTDASGRQINVNQPGDYSVTVTNSNGCSATKRFKVSAVDEAGIANISSEGRRVIITPANSGDFEYSLDGNNFQQSNIFENISGGIYTAYIRDLGGCSTAFEEFPHIVLPNFITPNNDGFNDHFQLKGVEYLGSSEIRIFDRYGKLLAAGKGAGFSWDGVLNGRDLPTGDYWYHIFIEGFEPVKGHFTLKR